MRCLQVQDNTRWRPAFRIHRKAGKRPPANLANAFFISFKLVAFSHSYIRINKPDLVRFSFSLPVAAASAEKLIRL